MGHTCADTDEDVFRVCSNCGKPGAADDFPPAVGFVAGRHAECRNCQLKRQIEAGRHYQECVAGLRDDPPQSDRARTREQKRAVEKAKSQPCQQCGQTMPSASMRFAYVNGERAFQLDRRPTGLHTETLLNELAKCEVVCVLCFDQYKSRKAKQARQKRDVVLRPRSGPDQVSDSYVGSLGTIKHYFRRPLDTIWYSK